MENARPQKYFGLKLYEELSWGSLEYGAQVVGSVFIALSTVGMVATAFGLIFSKAFVIMLLMHSMCNILLVKSCLMIYSIMDETIRSPIIVGWLITSAVVGIFGMFLSLLLLRTNSTSVPGFVLLLLIGLIGGFWVHGWMIVLSYWRSTCVNNDEENIYCEVSSEPAPFYNIELPVPSAPEREELYSVVTNL